MTFQYPQPTLNQPPQMAIPYGKFIDIDEKYYSPQKPLPAIHSFSKGRELKPHGTNGSYQPTPFIEKTPPLALDEGGLKVNYGSYIYQQKTGFDYAHPR